jgi:AcrR family transcriptional regulator
MDTRTRMLDAAESLLRTSPARDISTRAVCEAVGVGAPVLYRLFGDKNGLLAAVVDNAFDRYLALKRAMP